MDKQRPRNTVLLSTFVIYTVPRRTCEVIVRLAHAARDDTGALSVFPTTQLVDRVRTVRRMTHPSRCLGNISVVTRWLPFTNTHAISALLTAPNITASKI